MDLKALYKLSYGMYIIGSRKGQQINAQVANSVIQVTSEPPTLAVSINKQNLTHEYITASRVLSVAVISSDAPLNLIGNFGFKSGRDLDKFSGVKYRLGATGSPIVEEAVNAFLEGEVFQEVDMGTHTVFMVKVIDAGVLGAQEPMTYAYYHQVKKGVSPKTAPTYINIKEDKPMSKDVKYVCSVCGYIYDPAVGDPDGGIEPGTPFEKIPDDWVCPVCGVGKDQFQKQE